MNLRLAVRRNWQSRWYANKKDFSKLLYEDQIIRAKLMEKLKQASVPRIFIERASNRVRVKIYTARPGIVIGRKGQEIENLEQITKEVSAELDDMFATYSEDFIEQMADSDQPFLLYHCTRGAHWKNYPNPKFQGKSPAKYPYKDCVVEMDDVLGRLVKKLEATKDPSEVNGMALVGILSAQLVHHHFIEDFPSTFARPAKPCIVVDKRTRPQPLLG